MIKKFTIISLGLCLIVGVFVVKNVSANPLSAAPSQYSSGATSSQTTVGINSTINFMTYDAYATSSPTLAEGATLLLQATGAATANLTLTIQYSQDGVDFYGDAINISTTSNSQNIAAPYTYVWLLGTTATSSRAIKFETPTRYTRIVASSTTATTSIWGQIVPTKQRAE